MNPRSTSRSLPISLFTFHSSIFLLLASCTHNHLGNLSPGDAFFVRSVKPVLESRCLPCHNGKVLQGRLNLESRETAFAPSPAGPLLVPGQPHNSRILTNLIAPVSHPQAMPPTGHGLSEVEIMLIEDWIEKGAPWPNGKPGRLKPRPGAEPRST